MLLALLCGEISSTSTHAGYVVDVGIPLRMVLIKKTASLMWWD